MRSETDNALDQIFESARAHGEESEPEHEIGDLQQAVLALWQVLSPAQRQAALAAYWDGRETWS